MSARRGGAGGRREPGWLAVLGAFCPAGRGGLAEREASVFIDGALSARDKRLLSAAVHATRRDPSAAAEHLRAARAAGAVADDDHVRRAYLGI